MKRLLILMALASLAGCGGTVQGCPLETPATAIDCRKAVEQGRMTKEQCYDAIEASCP